MKPGGTKGVFPGSAAWFVFLGFLAASVSAQDVPRMSPGELAAHLGKADLIVLDVRAEADWKASDKKIQGALREDPRGVGKWAPNYPKEKTIVLYCA